MNAPKRTKSKYLLVVAFFTSFVFVFLSISFHHKSAPPLPFDTNAFVSTTNYEVILLTPNPTVLQRAAYLIGKMDFHFRGTRSITISKTTGPQIELQSLLTGCTVISGTRYLMPRDVTDADVTFSTTNSMNGELFVAAVESNLLKSDVDWGDRKEPASLLRFPEQKVIVVLPKSEVADFLRTNGIDAHRFEDDRR